MSKKIAIMGHLGIVRDVAKKNSEQLFAETGHNTGNVAFWYGVGRHILNDRTYIGWHYPVEKINKEHDALVLVAANWIGPHTDLTALANMIEKCTLPVIILGLGAQAGINAGKKHIELTDGTKRFLEIVAAKNIAVGTRGPFSAEVISDYGVRNVIVMGCPSNFINYREDLGQLIADKFQQLRTRRIALNFDLEGAIVPLVRQFAAWLDTYGGAFVCQNPLDPIRLARNDYDLEKDAALFSRVKEVVAPQLSDERFTWFMSTYFQAFYDADNWMGYLSTCDLSLGSRLHGNILAMHAETPALVIPHDSRTKELCETLKFPTVSFPHAKECQTPEQLIEHLDFDGQAYDANRRMLAERYTSLLRRANVDISSELLKFTKLQSAA